VADTATKFLKQEFKDQFLVCRDTGHTWVLQAYIDERRSTGEVVRELQCPQCTTERIERVGARSGEVYSRRYKYPDGYLIKDKQIRKGINKQEIRAESIRRMLGGLTVG
jgi:hypothetical protein